MRKSVLTPCLELKEQLLNISGIVDDFQQKRPSATDDWLSWLRRTEEVLKKYNYGEAAELAGIRAAVLAAKEKGETRKSKKKAQMQKALETVQAAQQVVYNKQIKLEEKIEQVRSMTRQVVQMAKAAGMIHFHPGDNFTAFLEHFLMQMQQHEQLQASANLAIASIGRYDTLRILAEEIELTS